MNIQKFFGKNTKNVGITAFATTLALTSVFAGFSFSNLAFADDALVTTGLQTAMVKFNQRSASNPQAIEDTLTQLKALEGQADDSDLNFDVLILESRALYWKGEHTTDNAQKLDLYTQGQNQAEAARQINDTYAEGYYYYGINLARWAESKGILESISRKGELVDKMNSSVAKTTRDGSPGESIDGDGPNRVFGRMYFKLPGILGGSHDKSVGYLKKAVADTVAAGFQVPLNTVYYAETLSTGSSSEKDQARQMLDDLLKQDPNTFNPKRVPENVEEFALAKQLRAQI